MWTQEHTCSTCCITLPFNGINLSLHPEKFRVKYENGEEEILDCRRMEPDGDFVPLQVNTTVCCKVKGGRFLATITEIIVESAEVCLN